MRIQELIETKYVHKNDGFSPSKLVHTKIVMYIILFQN